MNERLAARIRGAGSRAVTDAKFQIRPRTPSPVKSSRVQLSPRRTLRAASRPRETPAVAKDKTPIEDHASRKRKRQPSPDKFLSPIAPALKKEAARPKAGNPKSARSLPQVILPPEEPMRKRQGKERKKSPPKEVDVDEDVEIKDEEGDNKPAGSSKDKERQKGTIQLTVHKVSGKKAGVTNEIDVVAQMVGETLLRLNRRLHSQLAQQVIEAYADELDIRFIEMTDALDAGNVLQQALRRAQRQRNSLRQEIMMVRKERSDTAKKMDDVRRQHQQDVKTSSDLRSVHHFLEDLQAVKERAVETGREDDGPPTVCTFKAVANIRVLTLVCMH